MKTRFFWAYQIRRLVEAGWTEEELGRALKATPERIRQYMTGKAIPEVVTQRDLLRLLTTYCKLAEASGRPLPRIVSDNGAPPPGYIADEPQPERGVYEDLHAPAGQRVFKVVSSVPGDVGIVIWPAAWVTPGFIASLERGLDLRDPQERLKAI